MTKLEQWLVKRIIRKEVVQGYDHDKRITGLYRMVKDACREEFNEDNDPTLHSALTDWFNDSLKETA